MSPFLAADCLDMCPKRDSSSYNRIRAAKHDSKPMCERIVQIGFAPDQESEFNIAAHLLHSCLIKSDNSQYESYESVIAIVLAMVGPSNSQFQISIIG